MDFLHEWEREMYGFSIVPRSATEVYNSRFSKQKPAFHNLKELQSVLLSHHSMLDWPRPKKYFIIL